MARISGAEILTRQLEVEGVDTVFNLPGDPMGEINTSMRQHGMRLINFRHEQASALAAQAYGYVTRRPGVAICPSGPAMTNALTALETARSNCWPVLVIGGTGATSRRPPRSRRRHPSASGRCRSKTRASFPTTPTPQSRR